MNLALEVPESELAQLRDVAKRLGMPVEEAARVLLAAQLTQSGPEFEQAMERVLEKNRELYRRLS